MNAQGVADHKKLIRPPRRAIPVTLVGLTLLAKAITSIKGYHRWQRYGILALSNPTGKPFLHVFFLGRKDHSTAGMETKNRLFLKLHSTTHVE